MKINQSLLQQKSDIHRIMASPEVLLTLELLRTEDLSVGQITEKLGMSCQSGVSKKLKKLQRLGLISKKRDGQYTMCHLIPGSQEAINELLGREVITE